MPARLVSAAVLAPPVAAALLAGPPYSSALVIIAAAVMAWEWARLCRGRLAEPAAALAAAAVVGAVATAAVGLYHVAGWIAVAGVATSLVAAPGERRASGPWLAFGVAYLAAACIAFLWLRALPQGGLAVIVWLVASVWATDTGAFLAGSRLGGPRLAPRLSPRKTWSGLAGGVASAAAVGAVCALALDGLAAALGAAGHWALAALAGAGLALVAQGGDLLESALKRRVGAKDASAIIPGHGGLLDRADGLLAASLGLGAALRLLQQAP